MIFERFLAGLTVLLAAAIVAVIGYVIWFEINDPGHGDITGKTYRPAYYYTSCTTSGKTTVCTPHYMPECFEVRYTDGRHDGDACVSPDEYERAEVGGYYPTPKEAQ